MIKIVIFDIGRVLVEWDPERYYAKKLGPKRAAEFFASVPIFDIHFRTDQGENFYDVIEEAAHAYPNWAAEIRAWATEWGDITKTPIAVTAEILDKLKKRGTPIWGSPISGQKIFPSPKPCTQRSINLIGFSSLAN